MLQFREGRPLSFSISLPRREDWRSLHGTPGPVTACWMLRMSSAQDTASGVRGMENENAAHGPSFSVAHRWP